MVALELIAVWWLLCVLTWHLDAITYLAAGERLNAGHALYALVPGDRALIVDTPYYHTPLLYPPLIAVIWRPLAALPALLGLWLWFAAASVAIFAAIWYVARDLRTSAIVALLVFSAAIGSQLSGANVNAFVILGALLLWDRADRRPWVGVVVGVLTAVKLSPGIFVIWLLAQRRWKAFAWAIAGLVGGLLVGVIGVGFATNLQAIDILRKATPQNLTVTGLTGIPWATMAVDVLGSVSVLLLARRPAASFRVAALTIMLGAPQVSLSTAAYGLLLVPPPRKSEARARATPSMEDVAQPSERSPAASEPDPAPGLHHELVAGLVDPSKGHRRHIGAGQVGRPSLGAVELGRTFPTDQ